jgi:hypothetical protein
MRVPREKFESKDSESSKVLFEAQLKYFPVLLLLFGE